MALEWSGKAGQGPLETLPFLTHVPAKYRHAASGKETIYQPSKYILQQPLGKDPWDDLLSYSPLVTQQGKQVQTAGALAKITDESCLPSQCRETLTGTMSLPVIFPALVYQSGWILQD